MSPRIGARFTLATALASLSLGCIHGPFTCPANGGRPWTELASPHFVVKTDVDPEGTLALAAELEGLHAVLGRLTGRAQAGPVEKVEVVVFADSVEFHTFDGPEEVRSAYAADRLLLDVEPEPTLVMYRGDDDQGRETFLHELTHRFLHDRFADIPVWLDEGFARFYETLRVDGRRGVLGAPWRRPSAATLWTDWVGTPGGGMIELKALPPLDDLVTADRAKFYGEGLDFSSRERRTSAEYTAAFRLVHMLMNGPNAGYRARFSSYLQALERGAKPGRALADAFAGIDAATLARDYYDYLAAQSLPVRVVDLGPPEPPPSVTARTMSDSEVHVLWSRLWPSEDAYRRFVEADLREAVRGDPSSTEAKLRAAIFLARGQRFQEAYAQMGAALAARPDDPRNLLGQLQIDESYNKEAFQCGGAEPRVDVTIDHLGRVAVTGAELNEVAWYHEKHGQPDAGLRFAEEAIRRSPLQWGGHDVLSMLLLQKGEVERALAANERAQELLPEWSKINLPARHRRMIAAAAPISPAGPLPPGAITAVFRAGMSGIGCCYALGRRGSANLMGKVGLKLTIQPDGAVKAAAIAESTLARPEVEACVLREAAKLRFPAFQGGDLELTYPLDFSPPPPKPPR